MARDWTELTENRTVKVGIIGMGYVGLPLALEFTHWGIQVCCARCVWGCKQDVSQRIDRGTTYAKMHRKHRTIVSVSHTSGYSDGHIFVVDSISFVQQHLSFVCANIIKIFIFENLNVAGDLNPDFF